MKDLHCLDDDGGFVENLMGLKGAVDALA